jgi:hypothetical protein
VELEKDRTGGAKEKQEIADAIAFPKFWQSFNIKVSVNQPSIPISL